MTADEKALLGVLVQHLADADGALLGMPSGSAAMGSIRRAINVAMVLKGLPSNVELEVRP